ncbi:hypothetical protein GE21DRAFT_1167818, partial [Neurospora crassa]
RTIFNKDEYLKYYNFNYIKNLRSRPRNIAPFVSDPYTPRLTTLINTQAPP